MRATHAVERYAGDNHWQGIRKAAFCRARQPTGLMLLSTPGISLVCCPPVPQLLLPLPLSPAPQLYPLATSILPNTPPTLQVSVLAAAAACQAPAAPGPGVSLPRLRGLALLDPADGAFEPLDPQRYPSCLPLISDEAPLQQQAVLEGGAGGSGGGRCGGESLPGRLPLLVVGAGRGGDCVPRAKGHRAFFQAARGPAVMVRRGWGAGHVCV